jgi:N1-aminopropylagmatine ureohydrolase
MTNHPVFIGSENAALLPEDAGFHIIPVPLEKSVSYGTGTNEGPLAILNASLQLELYDGISIPADHGIHTCPFVDCHGQIESVLSNIAGATQNSIDCGKIPILLGGEHTITIGAARAIKKTGRRVGFIQFDAHADLRDSYQDNPFSHACVMRRVIELGFDIFQIGVRSLSKNEHMLRRQQNIPHLDAVDINRNNTFNNILPDDFPKTVFLTIDVDCLDPSIMPATGTPEPGGLTWHQMMAILEDVIRDRIVIGMDIVELAPVSNLIYPDYTAARLVYNTIGMIARNQRPHPWGIAPPSSIE